jgi:outer membrane protein
MEGFGEAGCLVRRGGLGRGALAVLFVSLLLSPVQAQQSGIGSQTPSQQPSRAPITVPITQQGTTTASPAEVAHTGMQETTVLATLSLQDAIRLSLKNNLTTLLANERSNEAKGLRTQARSYLLPNVSGRASQFNETQNLAALGLTSIGGPFSIPPFLGPFKSFDARLVLEQSIFNLSSIRQYQAGKAGVRIADLQEQLAREQVATGTALAYLDAIRTERNVQTAQANLELARTLLTLARNQKNAGIATGVDVTRAETRVAQEQVSVAQAETNATQAMLQLLRIVGLPLRSEPTLSDPLRFNNDPLPSDQTAIAAARQQRPEIRIAEEQVNQLNLERKSVKAQLLPDVEFLADYGNSGITPANTALATRNVGVRLNVPIFNGGLTLGRIQQAESRLRQVQLQLTDTQAQVEEDVRNALQTLGSSAEQVRAAEQSVTLAERELQMARDRFAAGVGDNIEVVNAQTSLAVSRDAETNALAQYNAARINLAAALGRAEQFRW